MSRNHYPLLLCDVNALARNMSRDVHVLLRDFTARPLHNNGPSSDIENTVPTLLAACVLWALSSNGYTRHSMYVCIYYVCTCMYICIYACMYVCIKLERKLRELKLDNTKSIRNVLLLSS
jgi:hypothetical protein